MEDRDGNFSLVFCKLSTQKECQSPKLILMTNILDLFSVAFWLKETLTKCTVYSGNLSSNIIIA